MSERVEHGGDVTAGAETLLPASRERVWQYLLDIPRSTRCLPRAHDVVQVGERTFRGSVRFRAGFVQFAFDATVELTELIPPERIRLTALATDPLTRETVTAHAVAELRDDGERTAIRYTLTVSSPGLFGSLGRRMLEEVNRRMIDAFFRCVERTLLSEQPVETHE